MSLHDPAGLVRASFPSLEFREVRIIEDGWDSLVLDLDNAWILRFPRRPEVADWLDREIALLPELAAKLPVTVPQFDLIARNSGACVAYRKIAGTPPTTGVSKRTGQDVGGFLSALHRFPVERARALGVSCFDPMAWRDRYRGRCAEFRQDVFPLLEPAERERADGVFGRVEELDFSPALIHGDLGPAHVLCRSGRVVGVIDWSDACVGDPALDLAWCLNGSASEVARGVASIYHADAATRVRAATYHQLGPWYEVVYGLKTGQERLVDSGMEGVRARLPPPASSRLGRRCCRIHGWPSGSTRSSRRCPCPCGRRLRGSSSLRTVRSSPGRSSGRWRRRGSKGSLRWPVPVPGSSSMRSSSTVRRPSSGGRRILTHCRCCGSASGARLRSPQAARSHEVIGSRVWPCPRQEWSIGVWSTTCRWTRHTPRPCSVRGRSLPTWGEQRRNPTST